MAFSGLTRTTSIPRPHGPAATDVAPPPTAGAAGTPAPAPGTGATDNPPLITPPKTSPALNTATNLTAVAKHPYGQTLPPGPKTPPAADAGAAPSASTAPAALPEPPPGTAGNQSGFNATQQYDDILAQLGKDWEQQQSSLANQMAAFQRRAASTSGSMGFSAGGGNSMGNASQALIQGQEVYTDAADKYSKNRMNTLLDKVDMQNRNDQAQQGRDFTANESRLTRDWTSGENLAHDTRALAHDTAMQGGAATGDTTGAAAPSAGTPGAHDGSVQGLIASGYNVVLPTGGNMANGLSYTMPDGSSGHMEGKDAMHILGTVADLMPGRNLSNTQKQEVIAYAVDYQKKNGRYPGAGELRDRLLDVFGGS